MNNKKKIISMAALCAAGFFALSIPGAEAHSGQGASNGRGKAGGGMLSWSQQEEMRKNHETLMKNREAHVQALGKVLFPSEEAPREGRLFSPEAIQKALPVMEQMFMDHHKTFEAGRSLLTRDQQELMQERMRMGQKNTRNERHPGHGTREAWGMGFMGGYLENALGLTPSQRESFRKNMEIDGVTLKKHQENRENFFQALREGTPTEEQLRSMAGERAAFWGEGMERMNGALEKLYPSFSENQKKAFEEMRGRMAENMEAGLFMAPRKGFPGREGHPKMESRDGRNQEHRPRQGGQGNSQTPGSSKASSEQLRPRMHKNQPSGQ